MRYPSTLGGIQYASQTHKAFATSDETRSYDDFDLILGTNDTLL